MPTLKMRTPCADKNDALGWTEWCVHQQHGVTIGLRSNSRDGLRLLKEALPRGCDGSDDTEVDIIFSLMVGGEGKRKGVRHFNLLYDGWTTVSRTHKLEEAVDTFVESLPARIATMSPAVLIAGSSLELGGQRVLVTGKAAAGVGQALVRAGAKPLAEEWVPVDGPTPALTLLVEEGKGKSFRPRTLSPGRAALALLEQAPAFRLQPEKVLSALSQVAQSSPTLQGRYLDADQVVNFVKRRLARGK